MATHASAAAHREARSPLVIDIAGLPRRPGSMLTFTETVTNPARMGLELIGVEAGTPLELDLRIESVSEGVLVSGSVVAQTTGECSRCLTELTGRVRIELTELFAYPDSTTDATTEEDEVGRVGASGVPDTVDVEQAIVDAVGLALPFSPLCREDCPGLCPQCGIPLDTAEPGHGHEQVDPRWSKLAGLFEQGGEDGERQ
ncbi:DUF177 domain-containing protein [uncultured Mycolicibacterium sp.]|uniref:YceD family protein n=1 Tax=uncultured Mycolicibacterium sp. TaxID=2320817 RepID=UPI00263152CC|nr:DUF177 domain-containing protein [uncultured Mycolicibacterium sp.]